MVIQRRSIDLKPLRFMSPRMATGLARAALAIGRLDQAVSGHPLLPALLYRARLEAARRHAAVDGMLIDAWHLAAIIEGLRLRIAPDLSMPDRGRIFDAAHHAFEQYQWLARPEFEQEGAIQDALAAIEGSAPAELPALVAGGLGFHAWIDRDGDRLSGRAALIRFWRTHGVVRTPVPLTAAAALQADTPWAATPWINHFLVGLAAEAEEMLQLLLTLERTWFSARRAVADRRRNSRAAAAIDVLAAAPLLSAKTLSLALGMAPRNAGALLDAFEAEGLVIEVSHRARRRLFGLSALAPLRDQTVGPRKPVPGRGRGRPRHSSLEISSMPDPALETPPQPLNPLERLSFDFSDLDHWLAEMNRVIHRAGQTLKHAQDRRRTEE